jgi:Holliday junction resolvase
VSTYRRGYDFEVRVMRRLEEQGWDVTRSGGSHGHADLVAVRACTTPRECPHHGPLSHVLYVQCKSGKTKISGRERMQLIDRARQVGATPVLALRGLRFEFLNQEVA